MTPDAFALLASYRSRGERLTEQAQTKLTPSEKERLNGFVEYARKHGIDIYFRHNVTLLIIGRKSYDARFAPIAPTLGFPIETPHRYREIPEAGHPGLPEYDRSQPFFLR